MKTKPILIIIAIIAVLACGFLFLRGKFLNKPEKGEIAQFLTAFNAQIQAGNIDSASAYFEEGQNSNVVKVLLSVLTNKTNTSGKAKPIFKVSINTEEAFIKLGNPEFATATIAVTFSHESLPAEQCTLLFTIHKIDDKQYKISQVDAKTFVKAYAAYQIKVYNKITPEKDIYQPITLAAFKTAEHLKTRYDSIVWFDHINNKTFYYVVKGKLPDGFMSVTDRNTENTDYKMGLVDPELKEIIPAEYDLIHNISGTINGLIEVEKGDKKGFYNLYGKLAVPVSYDEIYPLKPGDNLAVLKNGDDYFYLKAADTTISEKIADFKIADIVSQIKTFGDSYRLSDESSKNVMEYNSRDYNTSVVVSPSYLANLQILPKFVDFPNPLRKGLSEDEDGGNGSRSIDVSFGGKKDNDDTNWFESAYYTIVNDYLGGRGGLYTNKNVLLVDKKHNRILGFNADSYVGGEEDGGELTGNCKENSMKAINDSLFEFKTTSQIGYDFNQTETISEGPFYHYLQLKNGKLAALTSERVFPTQYVQLDDSYLRGCYVIAWGIYPDRKTKTIDHVNKDMLQYMKNEIYASYRYKFKNKKWNDLFDYRFMNTNGDTTKNGNVDDSLTVIDKYNIAFINNKLNEKPLNIKKINALTTR